MRASAPCSRPPTPEGRAASGSRVCNEDLLHVVQGIGNAAGSQGWASTLNLPTKVTSTSNTAPGLGPAGDKITTGAGGDRITGAAENDEIDAGGAPYKGQEALAPTWTGHASSAHGTAEVDATIEAARASFAMLR